MSRFLKAPFPYFGGKSKAAEEAWTRFGQIKNYIEPFAGSAAVLLSRPDYESGMVETINDINGYLSNFWRAVKHDPDSVARHADFPVSEIDLIARHSFLLAEGDWLVDELKKDPDFYCPKLAGWYAWGANIWVGEGWCDGTRPEASLKKPHLGNAGTGINRKLPHLGNAGTGVTRSEFIRHWMDVLAERLRDVRVCCGDWSRVLTPSVTTKHGITGVFLDPPYDGAGTSHSVDYGQSCVWDDVVSWCKNHGDDPKMRIALCGYMDPSIELPGWSAYHWKASKGYAGKDNKNRKKETIWFSPHCLSDGPLFSFLSGENE